MDWFQKEIQSVIVGDIPPSKIKIKDLKPVIQQWIENLNLMEPAAKEIQLSHTINWLKQDSKLTIDQISFALHLVEKTALSRRVSALASRKFYSRIVKDNKNHVVTLEGLQAYISVKHPALTVYYIDTPAKLPIDDFRMKLTSAQPVCIIMQHDANMHKTLIRVGKMQDGRLQVQIFDSLGITPTRSPNNSDVSLLVKRHLAGVLEIFSTVCPVGLVEAIDIPRQRDATNCSMFVLFDLDNSIRLLQDNKPLFIRDAADNIVPDGSFLNIAQSGLAAGASIDPTHLRKMKDENDEPTGNSLALCMASDMLPFFLKKPPIIAQQNHREPGDSETDKEDDGCVLM